MFEVGKQPFDSAQGDIPQGNTVRGDIAQDIIYTKLYLCVRLSGVEAHFILTSKPNHYLTTIISNEFAGSSTLISWSSFVIFLSSLITGFIFPSTSS